MEIWVYRVCDSYGWREEVGEDLTGLYQEESKQLKKKYWHL